jgi:uncharacterized protein
MTSALITCSNVVLVATLAIIVPVLPSLVFRVGSKSNKPSEHLQFSSKMPTERPIFLPTSGAPGLFCDQQSSLAVILTHPWGPLGGNMHNNVVVAGARYFQQMGITTLRFDFVGWQLSWGTDQARQVEEAAQFLLEQQLENPPQQLRPPTKILLVGYSYGSLLAASASATIDQVVACVSIAPPWSVKHWLLLFNSNHHLSQAKLKTNLPRLFLIGDHDNFTSELAFWKTLEGFPGESTTGQVIENADHFFRRREAELMQTIGQWLLQVFPKCQGDLKKLALGEVYE